MAVYTSPLQGRSPWARQRVVAASRLRDKLPSAPLPGRGSRLEVLQAGKHWFDINDRCSVNGFDGADLQPVLADVSHGDPMKAQWIWPVRRSRREDAGKRVALVPAWGATTKQWHSPHPTPSFNPRAPRGARHWQTGSRRHNNRNKGIYFVTQ